MATPVKLSGRTAVVTGAASGIGRASARLLAQRGCPLVLVDKDEEGLAGTAEGLRVPVMTKVMDVSDRWAHQQLAAEVKDWNGPIGLVLNNAGVTVSQTIAESSPEDLEWLMGINFWGVVHGTQAYLPILLEQDSGVIANVSSIFGIIAWPTQGIYNASKFAVKGFTESLRHELHGTNVSAVCIHPGGIDTNIVNNARIHVDDLGRTDPEALKRDFKKVARTSPDKAAKTIVEGIEKGKVKILIGPDAVATDWLQRTVPVNYYSVIRRLQPLLRR
ncbi:SDR family NAD(P)-dependent oxidoreductase [Conexibacter sp. W3-3-2]|uniref:Acetoin dehydrogenase n=1 Tax=Paraconexibacter algicola TaxID=2133960 RepID=A0A2T4ULM8_9ACTN|nr:MULTISPECIES: SDR family NAD(P)-dependent oxidoreductase [Solirubrobacterales]MTD46457.1 SDR family NAD(P)-dependent oxidoreductase [Conexibacter sp. W3-3-2]PTL60108.1 acetoin dehydrogenase [Paraconexibacter algicola]